MRRIEDVEIERLNDDRERRRRRKRRIDKVKCSRR